MRHLIFSTLILLVALIPQQDSGARIINVPDDRETIQEAINAASRDVIDTVLVQPGVYNETINDVVGREIVVGSLYITTREDHFINETIIDAEGAGRVLTFQNHEGPGTQWIGFTITGGSSTYGAGIYCLGTSPTFSHMIIFGNTAIRPNDAGGFGGAFYITTRADNEDEVAEPLLTNSTIYGNHGEGGRGGIHIYRNGNPTLINCIHWNNTDGEDNGISVITAGFGITYSDIQSGYEGEGNIDADPELLNPDDGEFNLSEGSPCIDTGDPESPRDIDNTRADIGALIYPQTPSISVNFQELNFDAINIGQSVDLSVRATNRGAVLLIIEDIFITPGDAPFEIIEGGDPTELEEGERLDIVIRFLPEDEGVFEATLIILNNDPNNEQVEVGLTGIGLPPQPDIEIEPNFFVFGEVPLYTNVDRVLTISNIGEVTLDVTAIEVTGDDADHFSVDMNGELEIEPGASFEVIVSFSPTDLRDFSALVTIESTSPGEEFIDPQHPYSSDLDIFGANSLFQYINRTCGFSGRIQLAESFKQSGEVASLRQRQEAIRELSTRIDWRQDFQATGQMTPEGDLESRELLDWIETKDSVFLSVKLRGLLIILPVITIILLVLSFFLIPFNIPVMMILIQLGIVGLYLRKINQYHDMIGKKYNLLKKYGKLLALIAKGLLVIGHQRRRFKLGA